MEHQAGMSSPAASSSDSTVTTPPTGTSPITLASSITGIGHSLPSESTTRPSAPVGPAVAPAAAAAAAAAPAAPAVGAPSCARTSATTPGSTSRNRPTSASSVPGGSDTRTLPSDSTPIALSTWLGVSVPDVQDEPDDTEKPARSSAVSSTSPST